MNLTTKQILLTGGSGFFGTNLAAEMTKRKLSFYAPKASDYDFRSMDSCMQATKDKQVVLHLAAQVGGISFLKANQGEVFFNNVMMGLNLIEAARLNSVEKFVTIGSVCEYPDVIPLPFKEEDIWLGFPAEDTAAYGLAKKTILVLGQTYRQQYGLNAIHIIPVNLYGPHDHFGSANAHVIPALIARIIDARDNNLNEVEIWGTGKATREFIYIDDAIEGTLFLAQNYNDSLPINLGTGQEVAVKQLVEMIIDITKYKGKIRWNSDKPEGTKRRQIDVSRAQRLGFKAKTSLYDGLTKTIGWYEAHKP